MLFCSHAASITFALSALSEISLGATPLSILSPFGLSEADFTFGTWDGQVSQTQVHQ